MMAAPLVSDWSNFLVAQAGASAALAGLIFVAVSINLSKIIELPGVSGRAAEALALLIGVLIIATLGLAPNQSQKVLGMEFLAVGIVLWVFTVTLHVRQLLRRTRHPWWWLGLRVTMCQLTTLSFCVAGILLLLGHPDGMSWLLPGCVFAFLTSTVCAWVLLIEILR
jgi:modulator of FtsH protease